MRLDETKYSIANLRDMLNRGDLVANKQYQRSPGLWPAAPRSYFIDTILDSYPFPKMYFHEYLAKTTKRTSTEIVDGQQRIMTIQDFLNDKFALGKNSRHFVGKRFSDLTEEEQDKFLSYTVSVDVIRDAGRVEILQMFRRMNAYTLPLNDPEKRHSEFFGEFKDYVTRALDSCVILTEWDIFTPRQIMRMLDAEFVADLTLAFEQGIGNTTKAALDKLYRDNEDNYPNASLRENQLLEIFTTITQDLSPLRETYMTKPFAFYALCCALFHNRFGIPDLEEKINLAPIGTLYGCAKDIALAKLCELAAAHESKDMSRYSEYVDAMSAGSNREKQRLVRIKTICQALRGQL